MVNSLFILPKIEKLLIVTFSPRSLSNFRESFVRWARGLFSSSRSFVWVAWASDNELFGKIIKHTTTCTLPARPPNLNRGENPDSAPTKRCVQRVFDKKSVFLVNFRRFFADLRIVKENFFDKSFVQVQRKSVSLGKPKIIIKSEIICLWQVLGVE